MPAAPSNPSISASAGPQPDFWVCIPARRASTRLPDKPLADIAGWPMVLWVAAAGLQSGARKVIVATDDTEIFDRVMQAVEREASGARGLPQLAPIGGYAPRNSVSPPTHLEATMTRADHPTGTDRLAEVASQYSASADQIIVNLQGDEPLMPPGLLGQVAHRLAQDPGAAVATAACPIKDSREVFSPHVVKLVCDIHGHALYFSRAPIPYWRDRWIALQENARPSQDLGPAGLPPQLPYLRHLGLYAYRAGPLRDFAQWPESPLEPLEKLEQLRWLHHGQKIAVETLLDPPPAGVDTPEDL
ncbi:MAG: 3-deoxy-manno-octulosonate cytidylyltransferase 2, partial [Pseudomonadota bacterium]